MTPAEIITRKLLDKIVAAGATLPVQSLLLEALEGERHEAPSSGILLTVHISGQLHEPQPIYTFDVSATLVVAVDDDKGGALFKANYNAIWAAFDNLARGDSCVTLGDEADTLEEGEAHVFAVDGFQMEEGDPPDFQSDDNGGSFTVSFAATVTGRAN